MHADQHPVPVSDTLGDRPHRRHHRLRMLAAVVGALGALFLASAGGAAWAATTFKDVPSDHPFAKDINWMASQGISTGYEDGTFRPTDDVTRQAMSAFLHRYNNQLKSVSALTSSSGLTQVTKYIDCPTGTRPFAGGGGASVANAAIAESIPTGSGWKIRWVSTNGAAINDNNLLLVVSCVPRND